MSYISDKNERLYVNVMGREYRFVAVFDTDEEANAYLKEHTDTAVCAVANDRIYIGSSKHYEHKVH